MYIPRHSDVLVARSKGSGSTGHTKIIVVICVVVVASTLTLVVVLYLLLRILRKRNHGPKYIPGKYLKNKWNNWMSEASYGQVPNRSTSPTREEDTAYRHAATVQPQATSNVRRDTSIRSTITLPSYSPSPKPTEQVIAREGERGGMDVVVEFPETAEEEETRREDHMEALYQIRLQRRREHEEREAQRRERREALARGDYARLEELRREQTRERRQRSGSGSSHQSFAQAIQQAQQQSRGRDRRISSVSYAALGYVRHDGSRVRANSSDSDHNPLLQNAASMNVDARNQSLSAPSGDHSRGGSISSVSTGGSDGANLTPVASNAPLTRALTHHSETDVTSLGMPPPDYDHLDWGDAPAYDDLVDSGENVRELQLRPVPTIQIDAVSSDAGDDNASEFPEPEPETASNTQHHDTSSHAGDETRPQSPESGPAPSTQTGAASQDTGREESAPLLREPEPASTTQTGAASQNANREEGAPQSPESGPAPSTETDVTSQNADREETVPQLPESGPASTTQTSPATSHNTATQESAPQLPPVGSLPAIEIDTFSSDSATAINHTDPQHPNEQHPSGSTNATGNS